MTATPDPPRRRGWRAGLVLLLAGGALGAGYLFREDLRDEWALRQFRRAAASGDPAELPQQRQQLLERLFRQEDKLDRAVRLADDPDPKVRAASVEVLLFGQPRAKKQYELDVRLGVRTSSWRTGIRGAVGRLLKDDDETVRKKALEAASELEQADTFGTELTDAFRTGSAPERALVAVGFAHWNGPLLREVIADPDQPDEVRIAAMRGLDVYGDKTVAAWRRELKDALVIALRSGNPEVRRAAILTLRYGEGAAGVWLDVLCDDREKELHPHALERWIRTLAHGTDGGRHWSDAHTVWYQSTGSSYRCAVAGYVLCEAARAQTKLLELSPLVAEVHALQDRQGPTGRAFDVQLARLGNVLSVLSAVRWYCEHVEKAPALVARLPHEPPTDAPAPVRDPKVFLFAQAKPVWEWCLARKDDYATRFLSANTIVRSYGGAGVPQPPQARPLGAVMNELLLDRNEFDRLRARYERK